MAFFEDWDWGKILSGAAQAAVPAITGYMGASKVADANQRAAEIAQANAAANRAALVKQNEVATNFLAPQVAAAQPANEYLQTVMAHNPMELTPAQNIELGDRTRAAVTATPTGLRGSGRYTTASINDVQNRGKAGMIAQNQARTDAAATQLAQRGSGAATGAANLASNLGGQVVNVNTAATDAAGNAITNTAATNAQTLGDIGSYFAQAMKDSDRTSRYQNFRTGA